MTSSLAPETELEQRVLDDPRLRAGLRWGRPRPGHPEGRVTDHVAGMLATITSDDPLRGDLRFLALIHDSFKAEAYTGDERLLIERDEQVVREALAAHPIFEQARPVEARIFRSARSGLGVPAWPLAS